MRRLFLSIACLSGAMIAQEILLMRLFSIIQWHHFAAMVISLALLGFGAAGTLIAIARRPLLRSFPQAYRLGALALGITAVGSFLLGQRLPFNPPELWWDPRQHAYLLALYLLLAMPFLSGATCIGLAFTQYPDLIPRIYRYDLVGAGAGALLIVGGLWRFHPLTCLLLIGAAGFVGALLGPAPAGRSWAWSFGPAGLGLVLAGGWLVWPPSLHISEFKGLSKALLLPDAKVVAERSGPLGLLSVVSSAAFHEIPPGSSLNYSGPPPPPQVLLFVDGDSPTVITRTPAEVRDLAYLDALSAALPYHLLRARAPQGTSQPPRVLVLGAGGGSDVLLALSQGAQPVEAVELNPQMVQLLRQDFGDFTRHLFDRPGVRLHLAEARGFVACSREHYDLIQMALLGSFSASVSGTQALSESYLYTVEAFQEYLQRLRPDGLLALTCWLKQPPRDELKLFATAVAALEREGVAQPAAHLAFIRSFNTATLVVSRAPLTPAQIGTVRAFCDERSFDLIHLPGLRPGEAPRYNRLDDPSLDLGVQALLSDRRSDFYRRYKFNVLPATDDRPYFFQFLTGRVLPELLASRGQGSVPFAEWGYLLLLVALLQAALASFGLILAPLFTLRRAVSAAPRRTFLRVGGYFLCLGLAFLFIEIAFIQKFTLFLCHPLYSAAVVLCAFLAFAGLGSGSSEQVARALRQRGCRPILGGVIAILVSLALLELALLPSLFRSLITLPLGVKAVLSILLIAPLAFGMGLPFPLGLRSVADAVPSLVPWAWGINGCASVLSALLATLLALHVGFSGVVLLAAGLYLVAGVTFPHRGGLHARPPI
jgi:SAM-dependent methyltransferase